MKKIMLSVFMAVALVAPAHCATYSAANQIQTVGEKLLTSNGISATNVKFVAVSDEPNNSNFTTTKTVNVSTAELAYAGNDNETAAIVANELGHIISGHASKNKVTKLLTQTANAEITTNAAAQTVIDNYKATKEDKEADIIGVNLMMKAGYNPLAAIVVLTKQTGTYWEVIKGTPANSDKAMNIYNYISYAYPAQLKVGYGCQEYRNFLTYAQEEVQKRNNSKKLQSKYEKTYKKAQKNSTSQLSKYIRRGGLSTWDAVYGLLNGAQ